METDVFDYLTEGVTEGAYSRALDAILARHHVRGWEDAMRSLVVSDLEILDDVVGCRDAGLDVMQLCVVQHVIALGCRCIDRTEGEDEGCARFLKIAMYQELGRLFTRS